VLQAARKEVRTGRAVGQQPGFFGEEFGEQIGHGASLQLAMARRRSNMELNSEMQSR
jgi:hypothetical protein